MSLVKGFSSPHFQNVLLTLFALTSCVELGLSQNTPPDEPSTTIRNYLRTAEIRKKIIILDPPRGTIVYRRRNIEGQTQDKNSTVGGKVLRQVVLSRKERRNRNRPPVITTIFSPGACDCMGYWDCITNNGHVYSYCGISDSEVCCFYLNKDGNNSSRSIVNNAIILGSSSSEETITETPTTDAEAQFSQELFATGNDFARTTATPAAAATSSSSTQLPSTLPDVDYFTSLENGNLKRIIMNASRNAQEKENEKKNGNGNVFDPVCGRQLLDWRLDSQAQFREWPWHVAVLEVNQDLYVCGAALIANDRVITAAHCVFPFSKPDSSKLKIRAGEYDVSTNSEPDPYYEVAVERIIIHPRYNNATLLNDIAIVKLASSLNFTSNVRPICLPSTNELQFRNGGQKCVVAGWGRISESSTFSVRMKEIVVPLWNHQKCQEQLRANFGNSYKLPPTVICAGELGHDACDGDGGGGMVCFNEEEKRWILTGIVSYGFGCGNVNTPGVYTNISPYLSWISAFDYLR